MKKLRLLVSALLIAVIMTGCSVATNVSKEDIKGAINLVSDIVKGTNSSSYDMSSIPEFNGKDAYVVLNNNEPNFDIVITVKNRGYDSSNFKTLITVNNKRESTENKYYVVAVNEFKEWNIDVLENKPSGW